MKKCLRRLIILISAIFAPYLAPHSFSNNIDSSFKYMEMWLDSQMAYKDIPGLAVAIVHDQDVIYSKGFGYSDLEQKISTKPNTIYGICSISKLFTSISVMQLAEQNQVNLYDNIANYLPWFNIRQSFPNSEPITIESLLTHTSGLPREADFPYWNGPDFNFPSREEAIQRLAKQTTIYPAKQYLQYSNLGMMVLGEIISSVSGLPYAQYVKQNILIPLTMDSTYTYLPTFLAGDQLATGYSAQNRNLKRDRLHSYQAKGLTPSAGLASTIEDLAKFAKWHFRLLTTNVNEILTSNTLHKMQRVHWYDPSDDDNIWGLGYYLSKHKDKPFFGHAGSCPGYETTITMDNSDKLGIIVMSNANGVNVDKLAFGIYDIIAPAIVKKAELAPTNQNYHPDLEKYTGLYENYPWPGEKAIYISNGQLVMTEFPTDKPTTTSRTRVLRYKSDNIFYAVNKQGDIGEEVNFIVDKNGMVTDIMIFSHFFHKIK